MKIRMCLMLALLAALIATPACDKNQPPTEAARPVGTLTNPDTREIEQFLYRYFASWSDGDIAAYREHFHTSATVRMVEGGKIILSNDLDEFVDLQATIVSESDQPMRECMTSCEIDYDPVAASATVSWTLEQGSLIQTGVDRFILLQDELGRWKIISLVFYRTS